MKPLSRFYATALALPVMALPATAFAEAFDRPIPQAQSATAEFWYAVASIALVLALVAMARLVARR